MKDLAVTFDESGDMYELDWNTLVRRAERFTKGSRLAPTTSDRKVVGFDEHMIEEPPSRGTTVHTNLNDDEIANFNFGHHTKCELCVQLGKDGTANHPLNDCWANPYSQRYRKGVYDMRLLECLRSGKPVPEIMKIYQSKSEEKPVALPSPPPKNNPSKEDKFPA